MAYRRHANRAATRNGDDSADKDDNCPRLSELLLGSMLPTFLLLLS